MKFERVTEKYQDYLTDESGIAGEAEWICFPREHDELCAAVQNARSMGLGVTVQGARTGAEGRAVPHGGVIVNLSRMNSILGLEDGHLRVQAGVPLRQVQSYLRRNAPGLCFAPSPSESTATLGGILAHGAHGGNRFSCGETSGHIKVLSGIPLSGETRIASVLELRLSPLPKELWSVLFFFRSEPKILPRSPHLSAAEVYDEAVFRLLRENRLSLPELRVLPEFPAGAQSALRLELSGGDGKTLEAELFDVLDAFLRLGGEESDTWAMQGEAEAEKLRGLRHAAAESMSLRFGPEGLRLWLGREDIY